LSLEASREFQDVNLTTTSTACIWCGRAFIPRTRGRKRQRSCRPTHRSRFWCALRKWASRLFDAGLISIEDLKRALTTNVHAAVDVKKMETVA
jgi:hypothetical protein